MTQAPFQHITSLQLVFGGKELLNQKMGEAEGGGISAYTGEKYSLDCLKQLSEVAPVVIISHKSRKDTDIKLQDMPSLKDTTEADQNHRQLAVLQQPKKIFIIKYTLNNAFVI